MAVSMHVEELGAGKAVVTFDGALVLGGSLRLIDSQLKELIATGTTRLLLDFTKVPFCDSSGLGAVVYTTGLARENGGAIRVCGLSERVANMLRITTMAQLLTIDEDRASGLAALNAQPAAT